MSCTTPCHCASVSVKPGVEAVSQHVSIVRNKGASVVVAVLCCRVERWSSTSTPLRVEPTDTFTPLAFPI
jgi:hypothetical protein